MEWVLNREVLGYTVVGQLQSTLARFLNWTFTVLVCALELKSPYVTKRTRHMASLAMISNRLGRNQKLDWCHTWNRFCYFCRCLAVSISECFVLIRVWVNCFEIFRTLSRCLNRWWRFLKAETLIILVDGNLWLDGILVLAKQEGLENRLPLGNRKMSKVDIFDIPTWYHTFEVSWCPVCLIEGTALSEILWNLFLRSWEYWFICKDGLRWSGFDKVMFFTVVVAWSFVSSVDAMNLSVAHWRVAKNLRSVIVLATNILGLSLILATWIKFVSFFLILKLSFTKVYWVYHFLRIWKIRVLH